MIGAPDKFLDGAYLSCRVNFKNGKLGAQDSILIKVRQPPRTDSNYIDFGLGVELTPKQVNVTVGDVIELKCKLDSIQNIQNISDRIQVIIYTIIYKPSK